MADDGIKRTTIRFSYAKKEHHKKAYDIMSTKPNSAKNEFMIQAIIEKEQGANLSDQLRRAVREELAHISFAPPMKIEKATVQQNTSEEQPKATEDKIPSDAIDFLNNLGK